MDQRPGKGSEGEIGEGLGGLLRRAWGQVREHPRAWSIALALLCTFAYFVGPPAWNQNSRLALTRALVEHGQVTIDEWQVTTGDKSARAGHFYSDKAPGVSLLATVPYAMFWAERKLVGGELPEVRVVPLDPAIRAAELTPAPEEREPGDVLTYNPAHQSALWWCRLVVISLPTLVAGAALYLLMLGELGGDRRRATWVSLLWLLATPALGYACGFYGHQLVADLLIASFALVVLARDGPRPSVPLLLGCLLGLAVTSEYTAAIPALLFVAWASWRRGLRFGAWVCVGGLPWALVLAGYHTWAFGGPLKTGYDFVYLDEFAEGMAVAYGLGPPKLGVLAQLLFGTYRGLFYLSPVLLLAAWGLGLRLFGRPPGGELDESREGARPGRPLRRGDLLLATSIIAWYLLLNSGYYMWDGGASLGPRHAVPMLPFLAIGLGPALRRLPGAIAALGAISCIHMVLITSAGPEAPAHGNSLWAYAVPKLFAPTQPGVATNLGRLLGLPGPVSLVPLFALWWLFWPSERRSGDKKREKDDRNKAGVAQRG